MSPEQKDKALATLARHFLTFTDHYSTIVWGVDAAQVLLDLGIVNCVQSATQADLRANPDLKLEIGRHYHIVDDTIVQLMCDLPGTDPEASIAKLIEELRK